MVQASLSCFSWQSFHGHPARPTGFTVVEVNVSEESSSFVALDQLHDHTQPKLAEVIVSFVFGVLWAR